MNMAIEPQSGLQALLLSVLTPGVLILDGESGFGDGFWEFLVPHLELLIPLLLQRQCFSVRAPQVFGVKGKGRGVEGGEISVDGGTMPCSVQIFVRVREPLVFLSNLQGLDFKTILCFRKV